jgi:hypothetical protein
MLKYWNKYWGIRIAASATLDDDTDRDDPPVLPEMSGVANV